MNISYATVLYDHIYDCQKEQIRALFSKMPTRQCPSAKKISQSCNIMNMGLGHLVMWQFGSFTSITLYCMTIEAWAVTNLTKVSHSGILAENRTQSIDNASLMLLSTTASQQSLKYIQNELTNLAHKT